MGQFLVGVCPLGDALYIWEKMVPNDGNLPRLIQSQNHILST